MRPRDTSGRYVSVVCVASSGGTINTNVISEFSSDPETARKLAHENASRQLDRWFRHYPQMLTENLSIVER